ncbi:polysaccharide deacetylase family protein [Parahaliea mediterranea]
MHDVMPTTLDRVEHLARRLRHGGHPPPLLLVVPGRHWTPADLDRLRRLAAAGHPLAGHGWHHRVDGYRNLRHRLHAAILSRDAGEHLSLDRAGVLALIRRCRAWFDERELPAPETYVPPAWAMGPVAPRDLRGLGFRWFEFLSGLYDSERDALQRLPLLGFEADTRLRRGLLRASNRLNTLAGRGTGRARLALHPRDEQLLLAKDLEHWLTAAGP